MRYDGAGDADDNGSLIIHNTFSYVVPAEDVAIRVDDWCKIEVVRVHQICHIRIGTIVANHLQNVNTYVCITVRAYLHLQIHTHT